MEKIFFWSQEEYGCLSNFSPVLLVINGEKYASVEHYYQSEKTLDLELKEKIRLASSAYKSKKMAKKVKDTLRADWSSYKLEVMKIALREKFKQEPFKSLLLKTKNSELFEDNPHDSFWGTGCLGGEGQGQNHLGRLLMEIRKELTFAN